MYRGARAVHDDPPACRLQAATDAEWRAVPDESLQECLWVSAG